MDKLVFNFGILLQLFYIKATSSECTQVQVSPDIVKTLQSHPNRQLGHNYPKDFDQCWKLQTSDNDFTVKLTVTEFNLQNPDNNGECLDWMKVYDVITDGDQDLIGTYCTTDIPAESVSTHTTLRVEFHSDHNVTKTGFKLLYTAIKPSTGGLSSKTIVAIVIGIYIFLFCVIVAVVSCVVKHKKSVSPGDDIIATPPIRRAVPSKTAKYKTKPEYAAECYLHGSQLGCGPRPHYTKEQSELKRKSLPKLYIPERAINVEKFNRVLEKRGKRTSSGSQEVVKKAKRIRRKKVQTIVRLWPDWVYDTEEKKTKAARWGQSNSLSAKRTMQMKKDEENQEATLKDSLQLESVTAECRFPKTFTRHISLTEEKVVVPCSGDVNVRQVHSREVVDRVQKVTPEDSLILESVTAENRFSKTFTRHISLTEENVVVPCSGDVNARQIHGKEVVDCVQKVTREDSLILESVMAENRFPNTLTRHISLTEENVVIPCSGDMRQINGREEVKRVQKLAREDSLILESVTADKTFTRTISLTDEKIVVPQFRQVDSIVPQSKAKCTKQAATGGVGLQGRNNGKFNTVDMCQIPQVDSVTIKID